MANIQLAFLHVAVLNERHLSQWQVVLMASVNGFQESSDGPCWWWDVPGPEIWPKNLLGLAQPAIDMTVECCKDNGLVFTPMETQCCRQIGSFLVLHPSLQSPVKPLHDPRRTLARPPHKPYKACQTIAAGVPRGFVNFFGNFVLVCITWFYQFVSF